MRKYTIDLDFETVDKIVFEELFGTWKTLKSDLGAGNHVFVWGDEEADDVEIQKHIDALELLLNWYGTPNQLQELKNA